MIYTDPILSRRSGGRRVRRRSFFSDFADPFVMENEVRRMLIKRFPQLPLVMSVLDLNGEVSVHARWDDQNIHRTFNGRIEDKYLAAPIVSSIASAVNISRGIPE